MLTEDCICQAKVQVPRERVISALTDPFLFSGISGHIQIVKVFDAVMQDFVPLYEAKSPQAKFKVMYVFEAGDDKLTAVKGEMVGPTYTPWGGYPTVGSLKRGDLIGV